MQKWNRNQKEHKELQKLQHGYIRKKNTKITSKLHIQIVKAIGAILLGFGLVQIGLALKSHDAGQRAQGFMTFFGGIVIYFAKDILDLILA